MKTITLELTEREAKILAYAVASQKEFNTFTVQECLTLHDKVETKLEEQA